MECISMEMLESRKITSLKPDPDPAFQKASDPGLSLKITCNSTD
jgi:hypothetical protein